MTKMFLFVFCTDCNVC